MAEDISVPTVGPVKKQYVVAAVVGIAGLVGYVYLKDRKAASSSSSSTAAGAIDPNAVDPNTGLTYGDELAAGASTYQNPNPGASGSGSVSSTSQPTSDQEWATQVEQDPAMASYDPTFLGATLGKYLDRQALTSDEQTVVRTAWAYHGHPPGNEPIIPVTSGGTPGGGTSGTGGTPPATPTGLHPLPGQVSAVSVGLGWNAVAGATGYRVGVRNNSNSTNPWSFQDIGVGTSTTVGALHSKQQYEFTVQARNSAGLSGYPPAIFVKTS